MLPRAAEVTQVDKLSLCLLMLTGQGTYEALVYEANLDGVYL